MGVSIYSHLGLTRGLLPGRFLIQNIVNIFHLSHFAVYSSIFSIVNRNDDDDDDDDDYGDGDDDDDAVGMALNLAVDGPTVTSRNTLFSSPEDPDRRWGPPSLVFSG